MYALHLTFIFGILLLSPSWAVEIDTGTEEVRASYCAEELAAEEIELMRLVLPAGPDGKAAQIPIVVRDKTYNAVSTHTWTFSGKVQPQADALRNFVFDLFEDLGSQGHVVPFDKVVIRPKEWFGPQQTMQLVGRKLNLRLGFWDSAMSDDRLRQSWDKGHQFDKESVLRSRWKVLNPVSDIRIFVSDTIRAAGRKMAGVIDVVIRKHSKAALDAPNDTQLQREMVLDILPLFHFHVSEQKLQVAQLEEIKKLMPGELIELLQAWKAEVASPELQQQLVEQAGRIVSNKADVDSSKTLVLLSLVASHANEKDINVGLNSISGDEPRYVEILMKKRNRIVVATGIFFAGYHEDFIDIQVNIHRGIETAGLDSAVRKFLARRNP